MLIPLSSNFSSNLASRLAQYIKVASTNGNVIVQATVTNSMYRIRSSHKSLTVYLEVRPEWSIKNVQSKARWKYTSRYLENTESPKTDINIKKQLAFFKSKIALDVIDIQEL